MRRLTRSICRQQFANMLLCGSHTHQFEFASTSWPTFVCHVKATCAWSFTQTVRKTLKQTNLCFNRFKDINPDDFPI